MRLLKSIKSYKIWIVAFFVILLPSVLCFTGVSWAQGNSSKMQMPQQAENEAIVCVKSTTPNCLSNNKLENKESKSQIEKYNADLIQKYWNSQTYSYHPLNEGDQVNGATITKKLTTTSLGANVEKDIAQGGNNIIDSVEMDNKALSSNLYSPQQELSDNSSSLTECPSELCDIYLVSCTDVDSYCASAANDQNVIWAQPNYKYYIDPDDTKKEFENQNFDDNNINIYSGDGGAINEDSENTKQGYNNVSSNSNPDANLINPNGINTYQNNDPLFSWQWGFDDTALGTNASIDADIAWKNSSAVSKTQNVVAVIDTGVDSTQEDLTNNMWADGNNYSELTQLGGGKYGINTTSQGLSSDPCNDERGHGTHCASAVSSVNNNSLGVCGVANNNTKIMACQVSEKYSQSGQTVFSVSTQDIVEAFNYVIVAKKAGVKVSACSCSFGISNVLYKHDYAQNSMIVQAGNNGIVTVFASGNNYQDLDGYTGLTHSNPYVITVGASNDYKESALYSNYGQHCVDVYAPGVEMLASASNKAGNGSYLPWWQDESNNWYYEQFSDTSSGITFYNYKDGLMNPVSSTISDGQVKIDVSELSTSKKNCLYAKIPQEKLSSLLSAGSNPYIAFAFNCSNCSLADNIIKVCTWDGSSYSPLYQYYCDAELKTKSHCSILANQPLTAVDGYVYVGFVFKLQDVTGNPTLNLDSIGFGKSPSNYSYMSGTSMACPVVSGAVGYVTSLLGNATTSDGALKAISYIKGSVEKSSALDDKCVTGGVINLNKAISGISGTTLPEAHNPVMQSASFSKVNNKIKATIKGNFFGTSAGSITVDGTSVSVESWSDNEVKISFDELSQHLATFVMTTSDSRTGRNYFDIAVDNMGYTSLPTSSITYSDSLGYSYTSNDLDVLKTATTSNAMYVLFGAQKADITLLEKYDYSKGTWFSVPISDLTNFVQCGIKGAYSLACGDSEIYLLYPSGDVSASSSSWKMRLATYSETQGKFIYDVDVSSHSTLGDMICNVDGQLWLAGYDFWEWDWDPEWDPRESHVAEIYPDTGKLGNNIGNFTSENYVSGGNMSVFDGKVIVSDSSVYFAHYSPSEYFPDINDPYFFDGSSWQSVNTSLYYDGVADSNQNFTSAGVATSTGVLEVGMVKNNAKSNMVDHFIENYDTRSWSEKSDVRFSSYKSVAMGAICHNNNIYVIANDGLGGGMSFKYMPLSKINMSSQDVKTLAKRENSEVPITDIMLNKTETTIKVDSGETLTATVKPDNASASSVKWFSNNNMVATVSGGVVEAKGKGQATITASNTDESVKATCDVTVEGCVIDDDVHNTEASSGLQQVASATGDNGLFILSTIVMLIGACLVAFVMYSRN